MIASASQDRLFRYDPPVSLTTVRAWQREIDRVFIPSDQLSRLVCRWEPGDVWQPIQRFVLWNCLDPVTATLATGDPAVPDWIVRELRGPSPRVSGHYCAPGYCRCDLKYNRYVGGAARAIDLATWQLYQETGLYGRRWWTIQGHKGGHRFVWDPDELEAMLSKLKGGPAQTPDPGDLPYAPFDARCLDRIGALDQVRTWTRTLEFAARNADDLEAQQITEAVTARDALWQWIDWGIEEAWDEGGSAFKQHLTNTYGRAIPGDRTDDLDYEDVERQFYAQVTD
jgi:hypothetical protein